MADTKTKPEETALTFDDVNYAPCPNCRTGVLHTIVFDPEATFERGQMPDGSNVPPEISSGGTAQRRCWHCDYSDSVALNPGEKYGRSS